MVCRFRLRHFVKRVPARILPGGKDFLRSGVCATGTIPIGRNRVLRVGISVPNCTALARRELIAAYYAEICPEEHPEWLTDDWPMWLWFACRSRIRFIDRVTAVHRRMVGSVSHGDSYRGRLASRDSAMETSLWFDERFTASRNRFRILRRRHVVGLWTFFVERGGSRRIPRALVGRSAADAALVFCPEGAIFLVKKILFRRKKQHL